MDAARPLLLGVLIAAGCASWPDAQPGDLAPSLTPVTALEVADGPRCDHAPTIQPLGDAVVVHDACATEVALYRRDVVAGSEPFLLGICTVPCADTAIAAGAVYAYTTAAIDGEGHAGPPSAEFYVTAPSGP